jgi:NAD dependent epimerase/dehydratase family enzyme
MATLVLDGMYVLPTRLQELGFQFEFTKAGLALENLLPG